MRKKYTLLAALLCAVSSMSQAQSVITTDRGQVSGFQENGADAYLGIPFAQPPVDEMRWKAPEEPAAWQGVRDGSKFRANCYQGEPKLFGPFTPEFLIELPVSEDCLYLNVWTPSERPAEQLPVIFWIHGGGFGSGSASIPIYNGSRLASQGAVVVSINYRLGVFGFMSHPALTAESSRETSGNYGMLDMVAALRWVKANVSKFGGDPDRVTIVGQSAGAGAVNNLMMMPDAAGLFAGAIPMSGSGGLFGRGRGSGLDQAEQNGLALAERAGVTSLVDLRGMSPDVLWELAQGPAPMSGADSAPGIRFGPFPDGKVITGSGSDSSANVVSPVPVMTGYTWDEGAISGLNMSPPPNAAEFVEQVRRRYGDNAEAILALYPHDTDAQAASSMEQMGRDQTLANQTWWGIDRYVNEAQTVYGYVFNRAYPAVEPERWKTFHTAEVPYLFNVLDTPGRAFTARDHEVAREMQNYWLNFARTGNPNAQGETAWHQLTPDSATVMVIGDSPGQRPAISTPERAAALRAAYEAEGAE